MYSSLQPVVVQRICIPTTARWYCVRFPCHPLFLIKYLLICGVDVCPPHVQTVSTSLMSRLVKIDIRTSKVLYLTSTLIIWLIIWGCRPQIELLTWTLRPWTLRFLTSKLISWIQNWEIWPQFEALTSKWEFHLKLRFWPRIEILTSNFEAQIQMF